MHLAILSLIIGLGSSAWAQNLSPLIKKSGLSQDHFSILVKKTGLEKPVYELNPKKLRIPASLTKLVTSAAVLSEFPSGHQFITELRKDSSGNLYLIGDGDPGFVSESMWNLVNNFLRSGIRKIEGDLFVDDSKFDQVRFDVSRNKKRVKRAYDSPVSGMSFNWNAVNIYVRPHKKTGRPVKIYVDPVSDYFEIVNKAKTGSGTKNSIQIRLEKRTEKDGKHIERIIITGEYGKQLKEKVYFKAVEKPSLWSLYNLKAFLQRRGVEVTGQLKIGSPPMSSKQVSNFKSRPLAHHVKNMMKYSNNFVAEMLIKNLAAHKGVRPASLGSGVEFLRKHLRTFGLKDFSLVNPSGLSRENKFTAEQFSELLAKVKENFKVYPEYAASLPVAGVDGTLKSRMKSLKKNSKLRAKTGMLNGVSGLAGYTDELVFVFIYNGPQKKLYKARDLIDQMAIQLTKQ